MAASTTTKKTTASTRTTNPAEEPAVQEKETAERVIPKEVDPNQIIPVYNGFRGKLIYVSPRSGEKYEWDEFGDTQDMELRELRNAKSSAKAFYENNWFMFGEDDLWVIDYLGLRQFYKLSLSIDTFDEVFEGTPAQVKSKIEKLPNGQKRSASYRARQLIEEGRIDSLKVISALEEALGVELIER